MFKVDISNVERGHVRKCLIVFYATFFLPICCVNVMIVTYFVNKILLLLKNGTCSWNEPYLIYYVYICGKNQKWFKPT